MISDTLSLLEKKLQEERQNYKKEAQRYQREIVNTENYILRKCKCRSNHQGCSIKKAVLKSFAKFTGKRLCHSLFFNEKTY